MLPQGKGAELIQLIITEVYNHENCYLKKNSIGITVKSEQKLRRMNK